MKNVFIIIIFLIQYCFASDDFLPIEKEAQYHAMFCARAERGNTKIEVMRCFEADNRVPSEIIQGKWFKQTQAYEKSNNEFDRQKAFLEYQNDFKEFSDKIETHNRFVLNYNIFVGQYNFKGESFPVKSYSMAAPNGHEMKFDTTSTTANKKVVYLDPRLKNYISIDPKDAEKVFVAKTPFGTLRLRVYGEISTFTEETQNPSMMAMKYEIINNDGNVVYEHTMKNQRPNVYMFQYGPTEYIRLRYNNKEIVKFDSVVRSTTLDESTPINIHLVKSPGGSGKPTQDRIEDTYIGGDEIYLLKMDYPFLRKAKLLIATLPATDENYDLIASNDKNALEAAFKKYYKK